MKSFTLGECARSLAAEGHIFGWGCFLYISPTREDKTPARLTTAEPQNRSRRLS